MRPATPLLLLASVCAAVGCGARTDLDAAPQGDATLQVSADSGDAQRPAFVDSASGVDSGPTPHDASLRDANGDTFNAPPDARQDARRESGAEAGKADAADASPADAAHDSPDDAAPAPPDSACPATYAAATGRCEMIGTSCTYPQGTCTCHGECGCGTPPSCAALGIECGPAYGCAGGALECGSCPAGETCGGGGTVGVCGTPLPPDGGVCLPATCDDLPGACGAVGDGCGAVINCAPCPTWGCDEEGTGCPSERPDAGAPCSSDGVPCAYTLWQQGCCVDTFHCVAGTWVMEPIQCPD